jgi:hypothetical protein
VRAAVWARDPRVAARARRFVSVFHGANGAGALVARVWGGVLAGGVAAPNASVRAAAAGVLLDAFPLGGGEETPGGMTLQAQVDVLNTLLSDESDVVRRVAAIGCGHVLARFWALLPGAVGRGLLHRLLGELLSDASSPAVRAGALEAMIPVLGNHLTHPVLSPALQAVAATALRDKSERVRLALTALLHRVKRIRGIRYYDLVPLAQLLPPLSLDPSARVRASLVGLLVNSYLPSGRSTSVIISRIVSLIRRDAGAARGMVAGAADAGAGVGVVARFVAGAIEFVQEAAGDDGPAGLDEDDEGDDDEEDLVDDDNGDDGVGSSRSSNAKNNRNKNKKQSRGKGKSTGRSRAAAAAEDQGEDEDRAVPTQVLEGLQREEATAVCATLIELCAVAWDSIALDLAERENAPLRRHLIETMSHGTLGQLIEQHSGNAAVRAAVLRMASRLPENIVPEIAEMCLPRLTNARAPRLSVAERTPILECLRGWMTPAKILDLIASWVDPSAVLGGGNDNGSGGGDEDDDHHHQHRAAITVVSKRKRLGAAVGDDAVYLCSAALDLLSLTLADKSKRSVVLGESIRVGVILSHLSAYLREMTRSCHGSSSSGSATAASRFTDSFFETILVSYTRTLLHACTSARADQDDDLAESYEDKVGAVLAWAGRDLVAALVDHSAAENSPPRARVRHDNGSAGNGSAGNGSTGNGSTGNGNGLAGPFGVGAASSAVRLPLCQVLMRHVLAVLADSLAIGLGGDAWALRVNAFTAKMLSAELGPAMNVLSDHVCKVVYQLCDSRRVPLDIAWPTVAALLGAFPRSAPASCVAVARNLVQSLVVRYADRGGLPTLLSGLVEASLAAMPAPGEGAGPRGPDNLPGAAAVLAGILVRRPALALGVGRAVFQSVHAAPADRIRAHRARAFANAIGKKVQLPHETTNEIDRVLANAASAANAAVHGQAIVA